MKNTISTGNCGEYFVAAELERRGFSVAVPMSNTELFDLLAYNRDTHRPSVIQVKTTLGEKAEWTLSAKNENITDENIIYVFVKLNELETPDYYIIPADVVANQIKKDFQEWLATPGRNGRPHRDNPVRKFTIPDERYKSNWDLIY